MRISDIAWHACCSLVVFSPQPGFRVILWREPTMHKAFQPPATYN